MPSLNLGVLAHVDAGKTSLTDRLLFEAGAIPQLGRVDDGTTRTDSMDLERQRGITIRTGVCSLQLGEVDVNLLDTPGHPDFIAEVERSLSVLDAAVLVLSSVEGVQPQTVVLWRSLRRLGVPTLLFVNKVDRSGADIERVVGEIHRRLSSEIVTLTRVSRQGCPNAGVQELSLDAKEVVETLALVDDEVMRNWVELDRVDEALVRDGLCRATASGKLFPVLCGSAVTGAGVSALGRAISTLLPTVNDAGAEMSATVFAIDHDDQGRRAWLRLWQGQMRVRENIQVLGREPMRITELNVLRPAGLVATPVVHAGQIAVARGLSKTRIGDVIGVPSPHRVPQFAPATMQASVEAVNPTQRGALFTALQTLSDEDPLIQPELSDVDGNAWVKIHGEVQKEVLSSVLADRFGVEARFLDTSVVCIERVSGIGEAVEVVNKFGNPYLATIGLRVIPRAEGSGVVFNSGAERGKLPGSFVVACEEGIRAALKQGLYGWSVTDCEVVLTCSGYFPRQSHSHQAFNKAMSSVATDFRNLGPVVVMSCLKQAGTVVCEPVEGYELDTPKSAMPAVMAVLGRLSGSPDGISEAADYAQLSGCIPAVNIPDLVAELPNITGGEGALITRPSHYARVTREQLPQRRHSGPDPRRRDAWFRTMTR